MFKKRKFLSILLSLIMVTTCFGNQQKDSKENNSELRERISKMEKDLEALRKAALQEDTTAQSESKVKEQKQVQTGAPWKLTSKAAGQKEAPSTSNLKLEKENPVIQEKSPVAQEKTPAAQEKSPATKNQDTKGMPLWSSLDIQFYGYVKLDASYDTSLTTAGNYATWVDSEATNEDDDGFNLTANQTRLGFKINGPENDNVKTNGLIEFDFYGNYAAENKAKIQMRHAYLNIYWPDDSFGMLAGQASDVMSPLCPPTLNYTVLWNAGNIGYRRPQLRLIKDWVSSDKSDVKFEVAMARTIGIDKGTNGNPPFAETGMDTGHPTLQSRLGISFPLMDYKPTKIGFSGHLGREEYDTQNNGDNQKFDSWSVNFDMTQPINKWLTINGELFTGENLGTYFGGIGQGVNTTTLKEIASKGGWVALGLGPWDNCNFNFGMGLDDVERDDVNSGNRIQNSSVFGNFICSINKSTQIGFELSQWDTAYKDQDDSDSTRAQMSLTYKF